MSLANKSGLSVYRIADFDYVYDLFYSDGRRNSPKLKTAEEISNFKAQYPCWEAQIDSEYAKKTFILKNGDLEYYLDIRKKNLGTVIEFCSNRLPQYLQDDSDPKSIEVREIVRHINTN
jgi:hypothetical protein